MAKAKRGRRDADVMALDGEIGAWRLLPELLLPASPPERKTLAAPSFSNGDFGFGPPLARAEDGAGWRRLLPWPRPSLSPGAQDTELRGGFTCPQRPEPVRCGDH